MKNNRRAPASHQVTATKRRAWSPLLKRIQPDAAGIDCGATSHYVAVPEDRDPQPVRTFSTFNRRSPSAGRLAGAVRYQDGGDGVDRGLLDSAA